MAAGVGASDPAVTGYVPLSHDLLRGELACRPSHRPGCRKLALDNLALLGAAPLAPSTYGVHHSIRNMA